MLGTQAKGLTVSGVAQSSINDQTAGTSLNLNAQNASVVGVSFNAAVWVLIALAVVWFAWGMVIHHTQMRERLAPANLAHNIHNLLSVTIMAAIGLVTMKILWTKATAWGIPGASYVANFFQAA